LLFCYNVLRKEVHYGANDGGTAGRDADHRLHQFGVISDVFPLETIRKILAETGRASRRQRDLPAHVMVYYVIAMALYMQASCREVLRCLMEGLRWLNLPAARNR